jgi:uncharacterized membrane protein
MSVETPEERLDEEEERVEGLDGSGSDMSRILGMSDAVFAFSMTFLVVTLVLPQVVLGQKYETLPTYLASTWPSLVAYFISFFIIASWWGGHRRVFSPIVRYDMALVRLNNLFLLIIAITPFLVDVLYYYGPGNTFGYGTFSNRLAVAIFAVAQMLAGLMLLAIWHHSTKDHRLVETRLSATWIRRTERSELFSVVVFAVSAVVAFVVPFLSILIWILVVVGGGGSRAHRASGRRPGRLVPAPASAPPLT